MADIPLDNSGSIPLPQTSAAENLPAQKAKLEVEKLLNDIENQRQQAGLQLQKLQLEAEKLAVDLQRSKLQDQLSADKLKLELTELKRSQWLKPSVIFPIVATAATLVFAQYQGVFEVAQKRLQIESTKIELQNKDLATRRDTLSTDITNLERARLALGDTVKTLEGEKARLQAALVERESALTKLGGDFARMSALSKSANEQANAAYPDFKLHAQDRIRSTLMQTCNPPVSPLVVRNSRNEAYVPFRGEVSHLLAESSLKCVQKVLLTSPLFARLLPDDRSALESKAVKAAENIDALRAGAAHAYRNPGAELDESWFRKPARDESEALTETWFDKTVRYYKPLPD
jgi:hypothetical protein